MSRYIITSTRTWTATHTVHSDDDSRREARQFVRDMDNARYYEGVTSEVTFVTAIDKVALTLEAWREAVAADNTRLGFLEWRSAQ